MRASDLTGNCFGLWVSNNLNKMKVVKEVLILMAFIKMETFVSKTAKNYLTT